MENDKQKEVKETNSKKGIVYLLTNPKMLDLVKVGITHGTSLKELKRRMQTLYGSGVPVPFNLEFAIIVDDPSEVEKNIHDAFDDHRVNPKREFFKIAHERVRSAMKLIGGEEVTLLGDDELPDSEISVDGRALLRANQELIKKRSNFNFRKVGIADGAELQFIRDERITVIVKSENTVMYKNEDLKKDEELKLSPAAGKVLEKMKLKTTVAGPDYWKYEGETLNERRKRMEEESESEE